MKPTPLDGHRNRTWDELQVGDESLLERSVTARDLYLFAHASGNLNPMHLPSTDLDGDGISDAVAPSMWVASLVSNVLGNLLPGPGTLIQTQQLDFGERARVGDRLDISVRLLQKLQPPRVLFEVKVRKDNGCLIARGLTEVDAPMTTVITAHTELPALMLDEHDHFARMIDVASQLPPMPTAVVCPDDANSLGGALLSWRRGLIVPLLVGCRAAIEEAAALAELDLDGLEIIDEPQSERAAARAVALVHEGRARALMKGNLHSDDLLAQVVRKEGGLRAGRRISHVFVLDVPTVAHPLFITDAAINIAPDLATKVDIVQNAIDLALACGIVLPRVGVLSAVETVNLNIPSSMDAAILAKMAERGQIRGGIVDGPLAMDNAIDPAAAATKKLVSPVAGAVQVLVVPNLEAGNMLAKQLTFVSRAQPAGVVVGASVPVMLTSRADNDQARLASCALAQLYDHYRRTGRSALTGETVSVPERRAA